MQLSIGAKLFFGGVPAGGALLVALLFTPTSYTVKPTSIIFRLLPGPVTCEGDAKIVDRQELIQQVSTLGADSVCVERVKEGGWKVTATKKHLVVDDPEIISG